MTCCDMALVCLHTAKPMGHSLVHMLWLAEPQISLAVTGTSACCDLNGLKHKARVTATIEADCLHSTKTH